MKKFILLLALLANAMVEATHSKSRCRWIPMNVILMKLPLHNFKNKGDVSSGQLNFKIIFLDKFKKSTTVIK